MFRVFRDKSFFAWYVCVPDQPSAAPFVKNCASPVMSFTFEEEFQVIIIDGEDLDKVRVNKNQQMETII